MATGESSLRLARALALLNVREEDTDGPALAEAIWLAHLLPAPPEAAAEAPRAPEPATETTSAAPRRKDEATPPLPPQMPTPSMEPKDAVPLFVQQTDAAGIGKLRGARVRVPAADALPQAGRIERALRPFMRRYPSRVLCELDTEATVLATAERQQVTPVFRPQLERWFDVSLVIDDSESMAVWSSTAREFKALLARHGAFRQVRMWRLRTEGEHLALKSEAGLDAGAGAFGGEEGRTLVLLLTHGTGAGWSGDLVGSWLRDIARRATVALVQMLPRHAWSYTALGDATERVLTRERAAPNRRLWLRDPIAGTWRDAPQAQAFPVLPLDPAAIAHWARFVMAPVKIDHPALWIAAGEGEGDEAQARNEAEEQKQVVAEDGRLRVQRFRAMASPKAFALLRLLATTPVTLPVMRLLQRASGEEPSSGPIAEVMLSGLLRRVGTGATEEEHVYDFDQDVRDWLLGGLSGSERRTADSALDPTRETLRKFVERRVGHSIKDFTALLLDPSGDELLPAEARAFVEVSRQLYRMRGLLPAGSAPPAVAARPVEPRRQTRQHLRVMLILGEWTAAGQSDSPQTDVIDSKRFEAALVARGHLLVDGLADVVVAISLVETDDCDAFVHPSASDEEFIERVESAVPRGALHGWTPGVQDMVRRPDDVDKLHHRLRTVLLRSTPETTSRRPPEERPQGELWQLRPGRLRVTLGALPGSGARQLLREVLSYPAWRQVFTGGIWLDEAPAQEHHYVRRGPRLFIANSGSRSPVLPDGVVLLLDYESGKKRPIDIGYVSYSSLQAELARRDVSRTLLKRIQEVSLGAPLLIGAAAAALQRSAKLQKLPQDLNARFHAIVAGLYRVLATNEREDLLEMAAWQPGFARPTIGQRSLARSLSWMQEDSESGWLIEDAREAIGRVARDDLLKQHSLVIHKLKSGEPSLRRYASRNLLLHAFVVSGVAGVLVELTDVRSLRSLLETDRTAVREQLRTLARIDSGHAQLARVLRVWENLKNHATMPASELAQRIAEPARVGEAPVWLRDSNSDVHDAFAAGFAGEGVKVWVPATGFDGGHSMLRGAHVTGDANDRDGFGTALVAMVASPTMGVAPDCRVWATRLLDDHGQGEVTALKKALQQLTSEPSSELPNIACWTLNTSHKADPLVDSDLREVAELFKVLSDRGVLFVVAVGDEGGSEFNFPAVLPFVLTVGACDDRGIPAGSSKRRRIGFLPPGLRKPPDVYGYGVDVLVPVLRRKGEMQRMSGSSFAAAYVSGIAALCQQAFDVRGQDLKDLILRTADDDGVARWRGNALVPDRPPPAMS